MEFDLSKIKKVFFVGIGGIGISAIARMFLMEGKIVLGSDTGENEITKELNNLGIQICFEQTLNMIPDDTDLIVYTIAIETYDPPFFTALKARGIAMYSYPEMLGIVTRNKKTIAVAGTHGKTTTTAMIGHVLRQTGIDASMIVGSLIHDEAGKLTNYIHGGSDYFVIEACEYRRSFLNINPSILVITNIDEDHLDYYKDINDIVSAFHELAMKVPADGYIVCDPSSPTVVKALVGVTAKVVDIKEYTHARTLMLPGAHNQFDASLASAVADICGVERSANDTALATFPGTWRRFEYKGTFSSGAIVYDDYAHHPAEINATVAGFREKYTDKKLTVFFQSHLFSRTKLLLDGFAQSLALIDHVYVLPIYPAREVDDGTISAEILAEKINSVGGTAQAISFDQAREIIKQDNFTDHDIVATMGAGEAHMILGGMVKK